MIGRLLIFSSSLFSIWVFAFLLCSLFFFFWPRLGLVAFVRPVASRSDDMEISVNTQLSGI